MPTYHDLLARIDAYIKKAGCEDSTASLRIFNDGKRLKTLRKRPGRIYPETIACAIKKIDELEAALKGEPA